MANRSLTAVLCLGLLLCVAGGAGVHAQEGSIQVLEPPASTAAACWRTSPSAPKSTFTSMGMTITQISSPTGRLTRATSSAPTARAAPGSHWPSAMPTTMHSSTQTVR